MPKPNGTSSGSSPDDDTTPLDVAREALGSPTVDDEQDTPASESSPEADENKSPAKAEEKWDPLSVVKKAVEDSKKPAEDKSEGTDDKQGADKSSPSDDSQKAKPGAEELGELTQEELDSYKPKTRQRMEKLLEDRQKATDELEELKPFAEQQKIFMEVLQDFKLDQNEVADLVLVGGLAKSQDPADLQEAITRTRDFLEKLELSAGVRLPEDLQKKVDEGILDADSAKELSDTRIKSQRNEQVAKTATTEVAVRDERTAIQNVTTTLVEWQRDKATKDPDYLSKQEFLQTETALLVSREPGGRVLDPARAKVIAEQAYTNVTERLKKVLPKPLEQKTVLRSGSAPPNVSAQPKTALDAARMALQKK